MLNLGMYSLSHHSNILVITRTVQGSCLEVSQHSSGGCNCVEPVGPATKARSQPRPRAVDPMASRRPPDASKQLTNRLINAGGEDSFYEKHSQGHDCVSCGGRTQCWHGGAD